MDVRPYRVQPGDSPARIAAVFAGCPKCSADLIAANPQKPAVRYPNGFVTFQSLRVGERLNLPDKWFNGALDRLPPSYFAGLPSMDGRVGEHTPDPGRHRPSPATFVRETAFGPLTVPGREAHHGKLGQPPIPHCHAFTAKFFPSQSISNTWAAALSSVLAANGFTNTGLIPPPAQDGSYTIQGIWEGAQPLDTTARLLDDGQGNRFQLAGATDNGPASPKSGPCAPVIKNPLELQNIAPPKKQLPPQGQKPQQQGAQQQQPPAPTTSSSSSTIWWVLGGAVVAGGAAYLATR